RKPRRGRRPWAVPPLGALPRAPGPFLARFRESGEPDERLRAPVTLECDLRLPLERLIDRHVEAAVDEFLRPGHRPWAVRRHRRRPIRGGRRALVVSDRDVSQADALGFLTVDVLREKQELERLAHADQPGKPLTLASALDSAPAEAGRPHLGATSNDTK